MPDLAANLDLLRANAPAVWLAELGAWLHNAGKLHPIFLRKQAGILNNSPFDYRHVVGLVLERWRGLSPETQISLAKSLDVKPQKFENRLAESAVFPFLRGPRIDLPAPFDDRDDYSLGDLIELQHTKWYDQPVEILFGRSSRLTQVLQVCHQQASGGEKRSEERERDSRPNLPPHHDPGEQYLEEQGQKTLPWCASTVFGHEYHVPADPSGEFLRWWNSTRFDLAARRITISGLVAVLGQALSDSCRPVNDVLVANVAFAAAAFFKAAVAKCVLETRWPDTFQWRLVRLAVNGPEFYGQAMRIPDVLARRDCFRDLLNSVRDELEERTPLANEIYRDDLGTVYLLFEPEGPDSLRRLGDLVRPVVASAWTTGAPEAALELSYDLRFSDPFALGEHGGPSFLMGKLLAEDPPPPSPSPQTVRAWWSGAVNAEVCSVCGVRPMGKARKSIERKVCDTCEQRRKDRSAGWLHHNDHTIWMEEVSDRNRRVALLAGRFRLDPWLADNGYISSTLVLVPADPTKGRPLEHKSASFPRLRRVWETTEEFWREAVDQVGDALPSPPPRLRLSGEFTASGSESPVRSHVYLLNIRGQRLSVVCAAPAEYIVVENLEVAARLWRQESSEKLSEFLFAETGMIEESRGMGGPTTLGSFFITESAADPSRYHPLIEILRGPRMAMLLVPAAHAVTAAEQILDKYGNEMGKVRDRLGLDVGLIYASVETPVRALLEAGRKMLRRTPTAETLTVAECRQHDADLDLMFQNGESWNVPLFMTDAKTRDDWYIGTSRSSSPGSTISFEPSTFDFQFLDSSSRRFEVAYNSAGRRLSPAFRHRPHALGRLPELRAIWEFLAGRLATTQIKQLDGLLAAKQAQWRSQWKDGRPWFEQNVLGNLEWSAFPSATEMEWLCAGVRSGALEDALEIFLGIE
jgi:hypothetical protein